MWRVGGQSIQTKHSCVPEVIEYNRDVLGKENKGKRSVWKPIRRTRGGRVKNTTIRYFIHPLFTQLCALCACIHFSIGNTNWQQTFSSFELICGSPWCVFASGQQYSEEFGKISMMRKVPAMKDGSFILTERYSYGLGLGWTSLHLQIIKIMFKGRCWYLWLFYLSVCAA